MKEYPKAMYLGTKKKRQKLTYAKDYDHEQVLRGKGFLAYDELPDESNHQNSECEQLKQDYQRLFNEHEQLKIDKEQLDLQWDNEQALKKRLEELSPPPPVVPDLVDYERLTVKQLTDELEKYGVTVGRGTNKADLIEMLKQLVGETRPPVNEITFM